MCKWQLKKYNSKELIANENKSNDPVLKLIKNIEKWNWGREESTSRYNLLSYLRLIDYLPLEIIEYKSQNEFNKIFNKILEKHIKGLTYIYNFIKKS